MRASASAVPVCWHRVGVDVVDVWAACRGDGVEGDGEVDACAVGVCGAAYRAPDRREGGVGEGGHVGCS